jgi:hypothetical protein
MYCYVHDCTCMLRIWKVCLHSNRYATKTKVNLGTRCSLKMSKNMNKCATENYILKFLTVSSVSSDSIVKGIIDDIINTAVKTAYAIGWFILNIQSDLFWHRCLERQAFCTPRIYTLSPSKSIKGSNYEDFLKDKHVLLCTLSFVFVQVKFLRNSEHSNYSILKFLTVSSVSSDSI